MSIRAFVGDRLANTRASLFFTVLLACAFLCSSCGGGGGGGGATYYDVQFINSSTVTATVIVGPDDGQTYQVTLSPGQSSNVLQIPANGCIPFQVEGFKNQLGGTICQSETYTLANQPEQPSFAHQGVVMSGKVQGSSIKQSERGKDAPWMGG